MENQLTNSLKERDYKYISKRVYDYSRINLTEQKRQLIISRLNKRVRLLGLDSLSSYVKYLKDEKGNREFLNMIDSLSTNYSLFFREKFHFKYLTKIILPKFFNKKLNIWSAASSTGQEIYSILITIHKFMDKSEKRIFYDLYASDISRNVLKRASKGLFNIEDLNGLSPELLREFFLKSRVEGSKEVKVKNRYIEEIKFFRQNLNKEEYKIPMMDVIFLRNILIYFDNKTKCEIVNRMFDYLNDDGYLILGHCESLICDSLNFTPLGKSIYQKRSK